MTKHTPAKCTVRFATTGACGKPAVWSDGEFAECADHAADFVALAHGRRIGTGPRVGDIVNVGRHGRLYAATVCKVGERGAVYAEVTYGNGVTRVVRV